MSGVKDITVKENQKFEIKIPFTGWPVPTCKWSLNGEPLEATPNRVMKVSDERYTRNMYDICTGELRYDGPLYDRFLHMTDNMLGPSPMHIKYSSYEYDGFCI